MKKKQMGSSALLLLTAFIWGLAFVAQSQGMEYIGPFTFNGARTLLAATILLPVGLARRRRIVRRGSRPYAARTQAVGGVLCGVLLFAASSLQQIAMQTTTAGKAGFLTALYIVLVPVLGVFWHKRVAPAVWAAVALATAGLYLLCGAGGALAVGDWLLVACALCFAGQILLVDRFAPVTEPFLLSGTQFLVCGLLSVPCMLLWEAPTLAGLAAAAMPLAYAGVLSSAVGYTLQIIGQRDTPPTVASLLMSLESVFSAVAGAWILHERLSAAERGGCLLVFAAVVLAQLPAPRRYKNA